MKKVIKYAFRLAILAFIVFGIHTAVIKCYANKSCYAGLSNIAPKNVGIVFGAGYLRSGKPSKYLRDRLSAGIELYKNKKVSKLLLTGDNGRKGHNEPRVMKEYCVAKGVPKEDIFVDCAGFDTYSSIWRAKNIFKIESAIMVTQNYHLDRAIYIGRMMKLNTVGYSANKGSYRGYRKNSIRELFALVKASMNLVTNRKPIFSNGSIDINGKSNFDDCN